MSVVPTYLTVTPAFENKMMSLDGSIAVNEKVEVTVVGVVDVTDPLNPILPEGLVLRLTSHGEKTEYARFPFDLGDEWVIDGANALGTLQLNTVQLQHAFACSCGQSTIEATVILENGEADNLYAKGSQLVRNWTQNPLDPVAGSSQMQAQMDVITERLETHQHNDLTAGEMAFPHNNLTGRDETGVHPALENAITLSTDIANEAKSIAETADENASEALRIASETGGEASEALRIANEAKVTADGAEVTANTALTTATTAQTTADTALTTADEAKAVTDIITDGGTIGELTSSASLGQTKTIVNQITQLLNTWRTS